MTGPAMLNEFAPPRQLNRWGAFGLRTLPMTIWTWIFLITNALYWAVFFYLLSRRRWNVAALAVGLFHMLLASVLSLAPFRALLDPDFQSRLGFIPFEGRVAVIPAVLTLGWALAAAWMAVAMGRGRWMWLIAAGDILFALNLGAAVLLLPLRGNVAYEEVRLGESLVFRGIAASVIFLLGFVIPPAACAVWALRRIGVGREEGAL